LVGTADLSAIERALTFGSGATPTYQQAEREAAGGCDQQGLAGILAHVVGSYRRRPGQVAASLRVAAIDRLGGSRHPTLRAARHRLGAVADVIARQMSLLRCALGCRHDTVL